MRGLSLLTGWRWLALVVAGGLAVAASVEAHPISTSFSSASVTFVAALGFIVAGLTAFFWYVDRKDLVRLAQEGREHPADAESSREAARKARIRPRLDYEITHEEAGEGQVRNTIWLMNHGPGIATSLALTFDALTAADVGSKPLGEIWTDPSVLRKASRIGPFLRSSLAVGSVNRVPIFRDSDKGSTGASKLPLGSSDVKTYTLLRVKAECTDVEGGPVDSIFDVLQKRGGFYTEKNGQRTWVESWRLLS